MLQFLMKVCQSQKMVIKRLWSKEEDQLLLRIVKQQNIVKWSTIAETFNTQISTLYKQKQINRTNKQCRQRWQNHLNPVLKNKSQWSKQEQFQLFNLFKENSHQWCIISSKLQQKGYDKRGENNIKNYFYLNIKHVIKKINGIIHKNNIEIKRKKSSLYNYNEKYAYKKRLSLERQIIKEKKIDEDISNQHSENVASQTIINQSELNKLAELHIIKQLNQEIVNKILLLAELKGNKKFVINDKDQLKQVIKIRNNLIQYIQSQDRFSDEEILQLAAGMLLISRKCKKKSCKATQEQQQYEFQGSMNQQIKSNSRKSDMMHKQYKNISVQKQEIKVQKFGQNILNKQKIYQMSQDQLLKRFIREDNENIADPNSNIKSKSNLSIFQNKQLEQLPNFFNPFTQQRSNLELSSDNLFATNFYSQKPLPSFDIFSYQMNPDFRSSNNLLNSNQQFFEQSRDYYKFNSTVYKDIDISNSQFLNKSLDLKGSYKYFKDEVNTNRADFNFLNSIKEIRPSNSIANHQELDFEFNEVNPFFIRNKETIPDKIFSSQFFQSKKSNSHLSNQSKSKTNKVSVGRGQQELGTNLFNLLESQNLLNRSWAYSGNRLENGNSLFNSNNYQANRKQQPFMFDLKNSNFHSFEEKQQ